MQKVPVFAIFVSLLIPLRAGASLPSSTGYNAVSSNYETDDGRSALGSYIYMTFEDTVFKTLALKEMQEPGDVFGDRELEFEEQGEVGVQVPAGSTIELLRAYEDEEGRSFLQMRINGNLLAVVDEADLTETQVVMIEREVARKGGGGSKIGKITSGIGMRKHPVTGKWRMHRGIDIAMPIGTPVKSRSAGTVTKAGAATGFGKAVYVKTGGYLFIYGHLSKVSVKVGQKVGSGALLGKSGCTGLCTGPHLHYEKRRG